MKINDWQIDTDAESVAFDGEQFDAWFLAFVDDTCRRDGGPETPTPEDEAALFDDIIDLCRTGHRRILQTPEQLVSAIRDWAEARRTQAAEE